MSEKQKEILETFEKVIPKLSEAEQDRLLAFGDGMAFMKGQQEEKKKEA